MNAKNITVKYTSYFALASLLLLSLVTSENAFAGLREIEETTSSFRTAIFALLGTGAAIYLLIRGFMLKINKIGWNDFLHSLFWTFVLAGLPVLFLLIYSVLAH